MSMRSLSLLERTMAKAKIKSQENARTQAQAIQQGVRSELKQKTPEAGMWAKEIEAIKTQKFSGIDEAVKAVATGVAARFSKDGQVHPAEVEFLETFLKSDPQILEQLRQGLVIK